MTSERLMLAAKLRAARQAAGLTQAALAARMDKPQSFVAKYELGLESLRMPGFFQVVGALGIEPIPVLKAAFGEADPRKDFSFPKRLKIEDFFAMAEALAANPYHLLANVPIPVPRVAQGRIETRKIANAWLQAQWPPPPMPRRKNAADHPWRKEETLSFQNRRSVRS